jgi:hypothetical protein
MGQRKNRLFLRWLLQFLASWLRNMLFLEAAVAKLQFCSRLLW